MNLSVIGPDAHPPQPLCAVAQRARLIRAASGLAALVFLACTARTTDTANDGSSSKAAAPSDSNSDSQPATEADDSTGDDDEADDDSSQSADDDAQADDEDDDDDEADDASSTAGGSSATADSGTPSEGTGGTPSTGGASAVSDPGTTTDPFAVAATCTSGVQGRTSGSSLMRPGEACIACHSSSGAPRFAIAGTVYPTGHEPNDCNGAGDMGALVVITDADGKAHELKVNSAGNFTLSGTLALPYTAKVVVGSSERAMGSTPSTGDCNSCHTQKGSSGAPGRIVLP